MFKEKLKNLLNSKLEQRDALNAQLIDSDNKEERAAIGETLKALGSEIKEVEDLLATVDEPAAEPEETGERKISVGKMNMRNETFNDEDLYESVNYRKAFMNYMKTGNKEELRVATKTTDTNISTVIPTNLVNKILEKYEQLGVIYNLVTHTSYPVGQTIPVDGVKPTASWVGEGVGSTPVTKTLGATITFTHFKLRCEVRWTEEVATMTLPAFETLFVKQVGEAMLRALEFAIVEGAGTNSPKGIITYAAPAGQALEVADGVKKLTYETLCSAEAAIPTEYEGTAKWCMTKKTFMKFIGMTDANGQPIARVNYGLGGKAERTLLGREVVLYIPQANSKLGNYEDTVTNDTIFAFIVDFGDYVLNKNYDLGISHATDWDNEDHKTKAVLACDGKLIITDSLVTLTKKKKAA